jgi:hypothetical protein
MNDAETMVELTDSRWSYHKQHTSKTAAASSFGFALLLQLAP